MCPRVSARHHLPPGPPLPGPVQSYLAWRHFIAFSRACRRRYGDVFLVRVLPWGNLICLAGSDEIRDVLTGDPELFHAGDVDEYLVPVMGERSVLVLDEDEHLVRRRQLLPPFHGEAVQRYGELIEQITLEEIAGWPRSRPFELAPRMRSITLEAILRAVVGVDDPARLALLRSLLPKLAAVTPPVMLMWVVPGLRHVGPWRRYLQVKQDADRLLFEEIASRRADPQLERRSDVLSMLIKHTELDDVELRDQLVSLLLAGHETTTATLAWAFERLLRHPAALEQARDGDEVYLQAIVRETLRLRPPLPMLTRRLTRPTELAGYQLPANVTIVPLLTLLHETPGLYPDAREFRPERFLGGDNGPPYAWLPFGGGRRRCIGAAFAELEMRTVLRTVLDHCELRPADPADEPIRQRHITIVPAHGARVVNG